MESYIQKNDIYSICLETTNKYSQNNQKISKDIVNLFTKLLLHSKNMYIVKYISTKLQQIQIKSGSILRKLLVEVYVFIAIINKPIIEQDVFNVKVSRKHICIDDKSFIQNLNTYTREDMFKNVSILHKTNPDFIWKVILHIGKQKEFIEQLQYLYSFTKNIKLLFLAYDTLYESYYYSCDYNDIIIQCMLKIDYIYIEKDIINNNSELYTTCMKYIPLKKNMIQKNVYQNYVSCEKNLQINEFQKNKSEKIYFEKSFT